MKLEDILVFTPVIPVLVIDDLAHARPIAEALVSGGLRVIEVTLRTPAALAAITEMRRVPDTVVGAGTVTTDGQLNQAVEAGAHFVVSPGLTDSVTEAALRANAPYLPGVATATDIMRGRDYGLSYFKFFPAEAAGGIRALTALSGPFYQCRFCPTGGITQATAPAWLSLSSVLCVGGSWIVPGGPPDFDAIYDRAVAASRLRTV